MCGIYGCVGKSNIEKTHECIHKIQHRGPDAIATKQLQDNVFFAHARLSIIDVSDEANQPMSDLSGRFTIVYNGEVYNYIEIRKVLEEKGYKFRTNSDTEVVLNAYIEWGADALNRFNGMWGFAIWDKKEQQLFLARDRFGVKPLYYYKGKDGFFFASEQKALFPIMPSRTINCSIFNSAKYFLYEATSESIFLEISKIKAGYYGILRNGCLKEYRWWNTLDNLAEVPSSYEEQVELLRELFEDACTIRMRSDVPIGTAVSGGVDSSAVIGMMHHVSEKGVKNISNDWQHTFVASMPGTSIDETQYAERASNYIGKSVNKVEIQQEISDTKLLDYMYMCEDPYITSPVPYMQTYKGIFDAGIKVTLDGHGADELFGGYAFDLPYAYCDARTDEEREMVYQTYMNCHTGGRMLSKSAFENKAYGVNSKCIDKLGVFNSQLYVQTHDEVLPTLFRCYDRYSMSNSVEIRMPFMDYRIVSFAFSIPWTSKVRNGYTKSIVRDMAAGVMDDRILYRKDKIGFNSPMTEWLLDDNVKSFILDAIHSVEFFNCSLINPTLAQIKIAEFYRKEDFEFIDGAQIWEILMPYFWEKALKQG